MTGGIRRHIALALIVSLILLPAALPAKARQGASVVVARTDGSKVSGELIAVKQDSLVLLSPIGKDDSVAVADIWAVTIKKPSKAGKGFLYGALIGGVAGGVFGAVTPTDSGYQALAVAVVAFVGAAAGGLIGLGLGAAAGTDETINFAGLTEVGRSQALDRLRGLARMPEAQ